MMADKTGTLRALLIASISNFNLDNFHAINRYHIKIYIKIKKLFSNITDFIKIRIFIF